MKYRKPSYAVLLTCILAGNIMAQENADPAVASVPSLPGMINEEIEHDLPFINDSP